MKIIEPSVENITPDKYDLDSIYEYCDKIYYGSQSKLIEKGDNSKPLNIFEHGTIYLLCSDYMVEKFKKDPYSEVNTLTIGGESKYYVTTNMRSFLENGWERYMVCISEPIMYHSKRYTFRVICDRNVSDEFIRFGKFSVEVFENNKEITFVRPYWTSKKYCEIISSEYGDKGLAAFEYCSDEENINETAMWAKSLIESEKYYLSLIDNKIKPQDARTVLPSSCKTELIVTGFYSDWIMFLSSRGSDTNTNPDILNITSKIHNILFNRKSNVDM